MSAHLIVLLKQKLTGVNAREAKRRRFHVSGSPGKHQWLQSAYDPGCRLCSGVSSFPPLAVNTDGCASRRSSDSLVMFRRKKRERGKETLLLDGVGRERRRGAAGGGRRGRGSGMVSWFKLGGSALRAMGALRGSPPSMAAVFTGGWLLGSSISSWQMAAFTMAAIREQEEYLNKVEAELVKELKRLKLEIMDELEESEARFDRELAVLKMMARMAMEKEMRMATEEEAASPGPLQGESGDFGDV
uniref:Uncharacterized protein n=1 Tax=Oryza punctata TaxID=4537 RepID=A0A0E0L6D9_ORYPU